MISGICLRILQLGKDISKRDETRLARYLLKLGGRHMEVPYPGISVLVCVFKFPHLI